MRSYFWKKDEIELRPFIEEDIPEIEEMLGNTEYRRQINRGIELPVCEEDPEGFIEWANTREKEIWLAVANKYNDAVGYVVIRGINERHGNTELFLTVFPKWQRRGYGRSAFEIAREYLFSERRMHKINSYVMSDNEAGISFLKKMGFAQECMRRDMFYQHGRYLDEYWFGLLEESAREAQKSETIPCESEQNLFHEWLHEELVGKNREDFWEYKGVRLRELKESDCESRKQMLYDSDGMRFYNWDVGLPYDTGRINEFEEKHLGFYHEDGRMVFTIVNEEDEYIGTIQLMDVSQKHGTFTFSIYIDKKMRNKGYGAKALYLLLYYGFMELRLHKCNTTVNEDNIASLKLMQKMGFQIEGKQKDMVYYNNNYVNLYHLGMIGNEI